jgi:hypothetical protein
MSQDLPQSKGEQFKTNISAHCDNKIVAIPKELNPPACPLSISMKAMEILAASKGQGKVFKVIPREISNVTTIKLILCI